MQRNIKIGTRESQLALWQARFIEQKIKPFAATELVEIKSDGDIDLVSPLYAMGVQGIFTKTLDAALLNNKIDIAVHSFKDVPTQLPAGLVVAAIPPRANYHDWLVIKQANISFDQPLSIATSSLRRKAQWLNNFPHHQFLPLRGNINTRLEKLKSNESCDGALFAAAGIERINLAIPNYIELDWMIPAPAQGAIAVVCRADDDETIAICKKLNDEKTALCTNIERQFLSTLMGGCSMPIAALAIFDERKNVHFKGNILTPDGKQKAEVELIFEPHQFADAGKMAAEKVLQNGGDRILAELKLI